MHLVDASLKLIPILSDFMPVQNLIFLSFEGIFWPNLYLIA